MYLALTADVTVTGKETFTNLADADDPAANLVGIAQSASQGAITARQLDARPIMRAGEVLETVPGVVISQHSGEGKANQYYLRGFNLDHGTDFATTIAGMPVNMPTHGHGHGYSDLNFLIPELVSGVQFSKGPYLVDQGDFATAGAANINYANTLDRPIVRAGMGDQGYARALVAGVFDAGRGRLLAALEVDHNDGPGSTRTTSARSTACPVHEGRRPQRVFDHRHGIPRDVEFDRPGAPAGRRAAASSGGSGRSIRPTAATAIATADRSSGSERRATPRRTLRHTGSSTTSISSPTSPSSSTIRSTAISFIRRTSGSSPAAG